jgi:predicted RNase H-like HicB family nuclease
MMAEKIIRIEIKEMIENGERYYLAESPDVPGFLAEADTLEEMRKIAPEVMEMILALDKKDELQKKMKKSLFQKVIYDIYYNTQVTSHLQYT